MKKLIAFFFGVSLLTACEKTITFNLDESAPKLVVDASIETGQPPVVLLSSSLNYFSEISPQILLGSFVHDAVITISNGSKSQVLKEYSFKTPFNKDIYFYSIDSANLSNSFNGEFNKTYSMQIKLADKMYTSFTNIPPSGKTLDSLWWKNSPKNPDTNKVIVMGRVTDPPGYGNYMRFYTQTGNGAFLPGLNSVFDDQVIDGVTYDVEVEHGIDRNTKLDPENYSFFNKGDTVTVKFCNIDKTLFDFWRTMEYSYSSIGNPFSTPTKVLGNIEGGALGYFGGYAVQYRSLIIPK
ncbi:MAG: DUF4249 domain-containing protein [Chitinophagaceae bacterium]